MTPRDVFAGWDVRRYGSVPSTMDIAAALIARGEVVCPTVVVAEHQTSGRGRADRGWRSVPGGSLQMTAIMSLPVPVMRLGPVPLLIGGIVAESLEALDASLTPALKWPNDVLIDGRKVAGILVVSRSTGDTSQLQVGIGVNIVDPDDSAGMAAGLGRLVGSNPKRAAIDRVRDALLGEVLSRLLTLEGELARDGGASGLDRWTRRASLLGQPVRVLDGNRTSDGILLGVDGTGALRIRGDSGQITTVVAGDLTRGPRPLIEDDAGDST